MIEYFRYTVNDTEIGTVTGGNINFNIENSLVQSASVSMVSDIDYDFPQDGEVKVFHVLNNTESLLGTFIASTPTSTIENGYKEFSVTCYSTLLILSKMKLETRYTCKKGTQITNEIVRLKDALGIKYSLDIQLSDKSTSNDIEFEIGTSYLQLFNTLLGIINYTNIFPNRDGSYASRPYVEPILRPIDITYSDQEVNNIVLPNFSLENDFFDVPNVYIRYVESAAGDLIATYENSNPSSPTSTFNTIRNPHIQEVRDAVDLATLFEIAKRDCLNNTSRYLTARIKTAINPLHWYNDTIQINLSGVLDNFESVSWSLNMTTGSDMNHVIRKVVQV